MTRDRQPVTVARVLLVEDHAGDADLVRLALEEWAETGAFEVDHVPRLATALARVAGSTAPDVILLDLSLPDAFGLDGLRRLKEAAPDVPVVVLTGSANREIAASAIQAGAQDYLVKGADAVLVPRALRYAIERHEHAARARLLGQAQAARVAADAARERMAVVAAASTAASQSLDDRHALRSLASAMVPRFADWCAIRTSGPQEDAPEWIVAHGDAAAAAALSARLDAVTAAPGAARGPDAVAASGSAELQQDVAAGGGSSPWSAALGELRARSAMTVPIPLRDEVLGVIVFAAVGRRFEADDLAVAEEVGRRAGVALANCRLYREARLAVSARNEFLAVAAHEFRTPLAVLQLKLQHVAVKQQASVCGTCEHAVPADYAGAARQISRLGRLIEGLLDVSRIAGGRVKLEREDLELRTVARDVVDRLADLAAQHRTQILLRAPEPVLGAWDRSAVERIVGNLLENALKFGGEKPVEVRVGPDGEDALIEVEDHGIGIAPDDVERIFGQFERAVSSRHFGGLGLGLYITRRLVEEHGGSMTVTSRPGSGALFTVRLPRTVPAAGTRHA
jgi:signal transduction histidine kinase/DNA-binding NarL/FixJ family response regulator